MNGVNRFSAERFSQLNALRGIAALTVVLNHFTVIDPLRELWRTPLRFVLNGHNAVILFFVISGFVLTLQLTSPEPPGYQDYLVKRVCRIYLPYLAVFGAACAIMLLVYRGPVSWAGVWTNSAWDGRIPVSEVLQHVFFVGVYRAEHIVPVIWTLIYEMRIALFFPLLVMAVRRLRVHHALALAIIASASAYLALLVEGKNPYNANLKVQWELTAHFAGIFVVGTLLALHRARWSAWLQVRGRKALVLGVSLALYFLSQAVLRVAPSGIADFLFDWGVATGAAGMVCVALSSAHITSILAWKPIVFVGMISYSLYLTHTVVLLAVIHAMPAANTAWLALAIAALLVIPVATLVYFAVERPSVAIGRALTLRRVLPVDRDRRRRGESAKEPGNASAVQSPGRR
ncbi:acyltransferase family protein [Paraburkholderia antibiotica]|uniref:Acyltransferase n=1 Tax=Paraburkholderia antibiotica TaxID=2728839 RepID=A0A7X9X4M8_9BURK|nr:acyltransferase [Paraburkholderia antibiotica]NML31364.1 acyltransferase [Paraburkholderia antibiotica]